MSATSNSYPKVIVYGEKGVEAGYFSIPYEPPPDKFTFVLERIEQLSIMFCKHREANYRFKQLFGGPIETDFSKALADESTFLRNLIRNPSEEFIKANRPQVVKKKED